MCPPLCAAVAAAVKPHACALSARALLGRALERGGVSISRPVAQLCILGTMLVLSKDLP